MGCGTAGSPRLLGLRLRRRELGRTRVCASSSWRREAALASFSSGSHRLLGLHLRRRELGLHAGLLRPLMLEG
eukprot:14326659-Alexandrium_andersonii.AAC.1